MEKIVSINPNASFIDDSQGWANSMEGVIITTTEQTIRMGISDRQNCCERSGYFFTEDNVEDFIGAELLSVDLTDAGLHTQTLTEEFEYGLDDCAVMFVTLRTSKGVLQFTAYNRHNGYYSHAAVVQSKQITESTHL